VSPQVKIRRLVAHTSAGPLTGYHSPRLAEGPTVPQIRESGLGDVRLSLHGPPSGSIRRPGPAVAGPGSMILAAVAARQQLPSFAAIGRRLRGRRRRCKWHAGPGCRGPALVESVIPTV
jgi:hypothetical protein